MPVQACAQSVGRDRLHVQSKWAYPLEALLSPDRRGDGLFADHRDRLRTHLSNVAVVFPFQRPLDDRSLCTCCALLVAELTMRGSMENGSLVTMPFAALPDIATSLGCGPRRDNSDQQARQAFLRQHQIRVGGASKCCLARENYFWWSINCRLRH